MFGGDLDLAGRDTRRVNPSTSIPATRQAGFRDFPPLA
jgi:hypothetical protein